jgi:CBS-domain-containing membrane protein
MFRHGIHRVTIPDSIYTPLAAGILILIAGLFGLVLGRPLVFASLGPTAFQLAEYPEQRSSRGYNVIVGHLSGLAMGFAAVALLHSWSAPSVLGVHDLTLIRVWTSVLAITLTSAVILVLRASHPPAGATALLVALGSFSNWSDVITVAIGVVLVGGLGEMFRYLRLYQFE